MPEATMAEVADEVSGASTDLVERVLSEYGDPATAEPGADGTGPTVDDGAGPTVDDGDVASGSGVTPEGPDSAAGTDEPAIGTELSTDEAPVRADGDGAVDSTTDEMANAGDVNTEESATTSGTAPRDDRGQTEAETGEPETEPETMTDDTPVGAPEELSEKEREVLEIVADRPDATQEEIADVLDVSRATISKRASGIDGFDWQRRAAFVDRLFEDDDALTRGDTQSPTVAPSSLERADARTDGDRRRPVEGKFASDGAADRGDIVARLDRIESRLDGLESRESGPDGISDPALAHKVVHACMESDNVSEEEELRVVSAVLSGDAGN